MLVYLSAFVGCLSLDLQIIKRVSFDCTIFVVNGNDRQPANRLNQTSLISLATQFDRPKSVHNRCVVGVLVAFLFCRFAVLNFLSI